MPSGTVPRLFALIIGINVYQDVTIPDLKGAVPDAEAIRKFLLNELDVPESQMTILLDSQATRSAIVGAFQHLADNSAIQRGDPILIYYAGHGSWATAPKDWHTEDGKIQMLVPVDCGIKDIHGIPDKTIGTLITKIADKKGDNITVIFDCCHSGSGTRGDSSVVSTRGFDYEKQLPKDLDAKLLTGDGNTRGVKLAAGFLNHGLESHVLFAACNSNEVAREAKGRGAFTTALLATLATVCTDKISYTDLLRRIDALPMQNPQCEGVKQHRFLFDSKAPTRRRTVYNVKTQDNELKIEAGVIHGITIGATFELWESHEAYDNKLECLGAVDVSQIGQFHSSASLLSHPKRDKTPTLAVQVGWGKKQVLRLYAPEEVSCVREAVLKQSAVTSSQRMEITLSDLGAAEISAVVVGNKIAFDTHDPRVMQYGLTRLPKTVDQDVDAIHSVLCGIAHYSYHLRRTNVTPPKFDGVPLREKIVVEFFRLQEGGFGEDGTRQMVPGANLNVPGAGIDLVVGEALYGFKIVNNSPLDLYPYFFFFDNCDLSISSLYQPPSAGEHTVDPPLKRGQELPIGYGSGGHTARRYTIEDPTQDLEVGFLKLFISSQYVDFSKVEQNSPFGDASRAMKKAKVSPPRFWDAIFIPLIQRRHAKPAAEAHEAASPPAADGASDIRRDIDLFKVQHQEDMRKLKSDLETLRKNKDAAREATKRLERDCQQIQQDVKRCAQEQGVFEEQLRSNRLAWKKAMAEIN